MTFPRVNPLDSRHPRHRAKGKREWNPPQESPKSQRDDGGPPRGERESVSESLNPADDVGDFWTRKFRLFFNSPSIPRNQREKKRERERKEERERESEPGNDIPFHDSRIFPSSLLLPLHSSREIPDEQSDRRRSGASLGLG